MAISDSKYKRAISAVRQQGRDDGRGLARYISQADALQILRDHKAGTLEGPNPLSGEWGGDPTSVADVIPFKVREIIDDPDYDDIESDLADAYEDGYSQGYMAAVRQIAVARRGTKGHATGRTPGRSRTRTGPPKSHAAALRRARRGR